jgi:hypothetical protein
VFGLLDIVHNFAQFSTYECQVYGAGGGCFSIGGRYADSNSPDTWSYGGVMQAGYKLTDQVRIGAFVDQTFDADGQDIDLDKNTPMFGFNLIWNQNPDWLGFQLKLGNTYQNLDANIHRATIGASQNANGDTEFTAQTYLAQASYRFLSDSKKSLYEPVFAARYSQVKMDGFTDNAGAPLIYNSAKNETTSLIMGMKTRHQLAPKWYALLDVAVEHDIDDDEDQLTARINGMTSSFSSASFNSTDDKTRLLGSLGGIYMITPNQQLEAKYYVQESRYNNNEDTLLFANYSLGF